MTRLALAGHAAWPQLTVRIAVAGTLEIVAVPMGATRATIQLTGEFDTTTAALVTAALDEQRAQGRRSVCLDLSRLTVLDHPGLRALVLAHNEFLYAGGELVLTGVESGIARLLHVTHLDEALFIGDEPDQPPRARHLAGFPAAEAR